MRYKSILIFVNDILSFENCERCFDIYLSGKIYYKIVFFIYYIFFMVIFFVKNCLLVIEMVIWDRL